MMRQISQCIFVAFSLVFLSSCGGSGSGHSAVVDMSLEKSVIALGEQTVLHAGISFDAGDVFHEDDVVSIVLRLPAGVNFVVDSGEIDELTGADHKVSAVVTACATGETFVVFNLEDSDLDTAANPGGNADAELKLTLFGSATLANGVITANANTAFACGAGFAGEAVVAISVG